MNQANNKNNELTRKLLLNSNSRGVKDEVVPMGQGAVDDTEFAVELGSQLNLARGPTRRAASGKVPILPVSIAGKVRSRPMRCSAGAMNSTLNP